jgi:cell division protein FtsQ
MPLEMEDSEDEQMPVRLVKGRPGSSRGRWWRPASAAGRFFLVSAALILLGGVAASAYILKTYLDHDARFRIRGADNIQASGLAEVSRAEMLPIFGEDIGRNIFFVPLNERRKQLEQLPWVERATVMRLLPDQIRVTVVERQPIAFTRMGSQIGLVDANGVLLTMPPALMAQRHYSFPVVTGINPQDPSSARKARMAVYQRLLAELDSNGQHISQQISEIDLTDPDDARVLMPEQGTDILAHFGDEHFMERYQRYKAHIADWRQQYPNLAAVDLRYDQQVVLQMAPNSNPVQSADGAETAAGAQPDNPPENAAQNRASSAAKKAGDKPALASHAAAEKTAARAALSSERPLSAGNKIKKVKAAHQAGEKSSAKTKTSRKMALLTASKGTKSKAVGQKRAGLKRAAFNVDRRPDASRKKTGAAGIGQ